MKLLIGSQQIEKRISELAIDLEESLEKEDEVIALGLLNGCVFFATDLLRKISNIKIKLEFIKAQSYDGTESTGDLILSGALPQVQDKTVLLLDDICDTGLTLLKLKEKLIKRGAKKVTTIVCLNKACKRKYDIVPDFVGFEIPDKFVIGYGLDYNGDFRTLPGIHIYNEDKI